MPPFEVEFACLIPKTKLEEELLEPFVTYKVVANHDIFDEPIELHKSYNSKTFVKPSNTYVLVNSTRGTALGLWTLPNYGKGRELPQSHGRMNYYHKGYDTNNYLVFFHDAYGNRRSYTIDYSKLLDVFNIVVFDYRSYGDSFEDDLNESGLVQDGVHILKWLNSHINGNIFLWGDNLGSAIAAHTAALVNNSNLHPCGLMLENPFTTMGEQLGYSWFVAKMNWFMPWYKTLIMDPLEESDLTFNTGKYLKEVSCPVGFLNWSPHRAKNFHFTVSSYDYHPSIFDRVIALETYRYYKSDINMASEMESFLRAFVDAGVKYCKAKKSK